MLVLQNPLTTLLNPTDDETFSATGLAQIGIATMFGFGVALALNKGAHLSPTASAVIGSVSLVPAWFVMQRITNK